MTDIVQKLRDRKQAIAWSRGIDTDYPTKWEPDALCQKAADEIATLRADCARLDRFEDWLADRAGPLLHIDDVREALT